MIKYLITILCICSFLFSGKHYITDTYPRIGGSSYQKHYVTDTYPRIGGSSYQKIYLSNSLKSVDMIVVCDNDLIKNNFWIVILNDYIK